MKNLKIYGLCLLLTTIHLVLPKYLLSQQLSLEWNNKFGFGYWDYVNEMIRLDNGNYLLAGSIVDTAEGIEYQAGKNNAWVSLVDSGGAILWQRAFVGNDFQTINSATEKSDGIFISGVFKDSLSCDSLSIFADSYLSGFYGVVNNVGTLVGLNKFGENATIYNLLSSGAHDGKIFITGSFKDSLKIGGSYFLPRFINSAFIGEVTNEGQLTNIELMHSSGDLHIKSIDCNDSVFCIAGMFSDSLFIKDTTIFSSGKSDAFVVCFDHRKNTKWIKTIKGNGDQIISDVSLSDDGHCAVVGYFDMNSFIDSTVFQSYGCKDILVAYLDGNGNLVWGKNIGNISNDYGHTIKIKGDNIYFSGSFIHKIALEQQNGNSTELQSLSPFGNSFIAKYNKTGILKTVYMLAGTSEDYCRAISVDDKDKITVAGNFYKKLVIENVEGTATEIHSSGDKDIFMLHFDDICKDFEIEAGPDTTICPEQSIWLISDDQSNAFKWEPGGILNQDLQIFEPGVYYLTATNQYGCIAQDSLMVTQGTLPQVFAGQDTILSAGQNLVLGDAIVSDSDNYSWESNGDGYFINENELSTEYYISNDEISHGSVILYLEAENICGTTQDSLMITIPMNEDGVIAYPNPFQSSVTVVCEDELIIQSIIITTQTGFVVLPSQVVNNYFFTYDLSSYPPGTFILYVSTSAGLVTKVVNKI